MKLFKILTSVIFFLLFSGAVKSQEFIYTGIEGRLTDAQTSEIQKAETNIQKAEKTIDEAEVIEAKYEALEKSNKEKKRKKFDSKTYEAKKLRIDAEKKYQKAYEGIIAVYSDVITQSDFYYADDQKKASALNEEAVGLLKDAEDKMKEYNKITGDEKELKNIRAKNLDGAISKSRALKEEALQKQFSALELILNQEVKKRADEEDRLAWENAVEENTIESFEEYIETFSKGKFVSQARDKIAKLKADIENNVSQNASNSQNTGLTFKVQIAASKRKLSNAKLLKYYSDVSKIESVYVGKYHKYRVGSFSSYKDALNFKNSLLSRVPDAFIVVFDKEGKQIEVTEDMKR
jgi:biotin-(acetyl-CoA carboxylase) ligase